MFSVIFEVNRKPERANDYLELAKHLKPILAKIDGFIDNERFESRGRKGWLLYATLTEITPDAKAASAGESHRLPAHFGLDTQLPGLVGHDIFESIVTPGKLAILASWKDAKAAVSWEPKSFDRAAALRHRVVRVIRDYGMFDRREAPQYYPPV